MWAVSLTAISNGPLEFGISNFTLQLDSTNFEGNVCKFINMVTVENFNVVSNRFNIDIIHTLCITFTFASGVSL
jgi:hypothetical protein